jgi:chitinase
LRRASARAEAGGAKGTAGPTSSGHRLASLLAVGLLAVTVLAATAVPAAAPLPVGVDGTAGKRALTKAEWLLANGRGAAGVAGPSDASSRFAVAAVGLPAFLAPPDVVVGEADGQVDLEVRLTHESEDPVQVSYTTAGGTATSGSACNSDFATASGTLSFNAHDVSESVSVTLHDCNDVEGLVSFTFTLSAASSNATIARTTTLVSIVDRSTLVTTPKLFVRDAVVDQKDGKVLVPVLLGGPGGQSSGSTVTVDYATSNRTAVAGTDYVGKSGVLSFAPGETAKTIEIDIIDRGPTAPRNFAVALTGPAGAEIADSTGIVQIDASTKAAIAQPAVLAPADVVVGEAEGYVDLPIRLSAPGLDPVQIDYETENSTGSAGTSCNSSSADYLSRNGTLTFLPGETTKVVRVPIIDCVEVDGFSSFRLLLSVPVNATISRMGTFVSIVNNGTPAATPRLFVRDATVDQRDGVVLVPVLLGGPGGQASTSTIIVNYSTSDRTATAGVDYVSVGGILTFAPGETAKTVVIPILDGGPKGPTSFALTLTGFGATSGPATISDGTGTIVIGATAAAPVVSPALSAPPDAVVGEGDGYVDLAVRLSAPGTNPVTVSYRTADSTARAGTSCVATDDYVRTDSDDHGALVFAPGETTKVVRIQLLDCADVQGMVSFRFTLSLPANATIARATTFVSVVNNAAQVATPRLFVRDAVVDQKDGSVLVPVLLGGARGHIGNGTVTVHYATDDRTAVGGVDYAPVSGTLSFAPGQTAKTVVVPIVDVGSKPIKSFVLTLSGPSGNAVIADATGTITIGSSAAVPVSQPSLSTPPDVVVGEADGYVDVPVRLSAPGLNPISVSYTTQTSTAGLGTSCDGDFVTTASATNGSLNFVPGETSKVVRVQLLDCTDVEGLVSFRFTISAPSNATIARPTTLISIVNASTVVATPRLVVRDALVDQKDGFVLVPVLLGGAAGQASDSPVSVDYATSDGTATAGVDYTGVSGTINFAPGQTAKTIVVPVANTGPKVSKSFAVTLNSPFNASLLDGTGIVTIGASAGSAVAVPVLSAPADLAVDEADGYVDLPVQLNVPGLNPVSVTFGTASGGGSANAGTSCPSDYVSAGGTLTFAPGETTKVVRLQLLDCVDVEGIVTFEFRLSLPANATIADTTTVISIVDNQTAWTPNNTALPTVSGATQVGQTLVATPGEWTGAPTSYQFSWHRCDSLGNCSPIAGETAATHVVGDGDGGNRLRVEVTATNSLGTSLPAYSAPTAVVPSLPGAPRNVNGVGGDKSATVSFLPPLSDGGSPLTYTLTVSPGGATVAASSSPIVVTGLTNGVHYTFTVTATNANGTGPSSAPSNPVIPAKPRAGVPEPQPPADPRPETPVFPSVTGLRKHPPPPP